MPGATGYRFEQDGEVSDPVTEATAAVRVAGGATYTYRVQALGGEDGDGDPAEPASGWSQAVTVDVDQPPAYDQDALRSDFDQPDGVFEHPGWPEVQRAEVRDGRLGILGDSRSGWIGSHHFDFVDGSAVVVEFAPLTVTSDDQWVSLQLVAGHGLEEEHFYAHLARVDFGEDKLWAVRVIDGATPVHDEFTEADTAVPAWARIWRDGSVLAFEISEDGTSWRTLAERERAGRSGGDPAPSAIPTEPPTSGRRRRCGAPSRGPDRCRGRRS